MTASLEGCHPDRGGPHLECPQREVIRSCALRAAGIVCESNLYRHKHIARFRCYEFISGADVVLEIADLHDPAVRIRTRLGTAGARCRRGGSRRCTRRGLSGAGATRRSRCRRRGARHCSSHGHRSCRRRRPGGATACGNSSGRHRKYPDPRSPAEALELRLTSNFSRITSPRSRRAQAQPHINYPS